MKVPHVDDLLRFSSLVHHVDLGPAVPLVVPDVDGHLRRLDLLEPVTLAPCPLIDVLRRRRDHSIKKNFNQVLKVVNHLLI